MLFRSEVRGVIGSRPPHFVREEERNRLLPIEEMFIDIGAGSRAGAAEMGINPGDPAVPDVAPASIAGGEIFMGKALDDRVGVLTVLEVAKRSARTDHPNTILAVRTVQEEIGARGARTAAQMLHPDLCLVIEGTPADDFPGLARELVQGGLGLGPQIRLFDPSMVGNRPLIDLAAAEARSLGLPYQVTVRENGGTDGGPIPCNRHGRADHGDRHPGPLCAQPDRPLLAHGSGTHHRAGNGSGPAPRRPDGSGLLK